MKRTTGQPALDHAPAPRRPPSPSGRPTAKTATSGLVPAHEGERVDAAHGLTDHGASGRPDRGAERRSRSARDRRGSRPAIAGRTSAPHPPWPIASASAVPERGPRHSRQSPRLDSDLPGEPATSNDSAAFSGNRGPGWTIRGAAAIRTSRSSFLRRGAARAALGAAPLGKRPLQAPRGVTVAASCCARRRAVSRPTPSDPCGGRQPHLSLRRPVARHSSEARFTSAPPAIEFLENTEVRSPARWSVRHP